MCASLKPSDDAAYVAQIVAEIHRLQFRINDGAVCEYASSLNGGRICTIEHSTKVGAGALMGALTTTPESASMTVLPGGS